MQRIMDGRAWMETFLSGVMRRAWIPLSRLANPPLTLRCFDTATALTIPNTNKSRNTTRSTITSLTRTVVPSTSSSSASSTSPSSTRSPPRRDSSSDLFQSMKSSSGIDALPVPRRLDTLWRRVVLFWTCTMLVSLASTGVGSFFWGF